MKKTMEKHLELEEKRRETTFDEIERKIFTKETDVVKKSKNIARDTAKQKRKSSSSSALSLKTKLCSTKNSVATDSRINQSPDKHVKDSNSFKSSKHRKSKDKVAKDVKPRKKKEKLKTVIEVDECMDSNASDWEEVDELQEIFDAPSTSTKNISNVEIELEHKDLLWGFKKRAKRSNEEIVSR